MYIIFTQHKDQFKASSCVESYAGWELHNLSIDLDWSSSFTNQGFRLSHILEHMTINTMMCIGMFVCLPTSVCIGPTITQHSQHYQVVMGQCLNMAEVGH